MWSGACGGHPRHAVRAAVHMQDGGNHDSKAPRRISCRAPSVSSCLAGSFTYGHACLCALCRAAASMASLSSVVTFLPRQTPSRRFHALRPRPRLRWLLSIKPPKAYEYPCSLRANKKVTVKTTVTCSSLERVTGLEPANTSLGSWGLTTWRHPRSAEC